MTVGQRIKALRLEKHMTQTELARPHYTHAHISTIESGKRQPSRGALEHIAAKLGVTTEEIETGKSQAEVTQLAIEIERIQELESAGEPMRQRPRPCGYNGRRNAWTATQQEARAIELEGHAWEQQGAFPEAINRYEAAIAKRVGLSIAERAYATAGLIRCHHALGDQDHGLSIGERYLFELEQTAGPVPDAMVRVQAPMIACYMTAGDRHRAGRAAEQALKLVVDVEDPHNVATMYINASQAQLANGDLKGAERSLSQAQTIFETTKQRNELGIVHASARLGVRAGDKRPKARKDLKKAVEILSETNPVEAANAKLELGRIERLEGHAAKGAEMITEALDVLVLEDELRMTAWGLRERARCLLGVDNDQAEKDIGEAISLYERSDQPLEIAMCHTVMGAIFESRGDAKATCESYRMAALIYLQSQEP